MTRPSLNSSAVRWLWLSAVVIVLDQLSKWYFVAHYRLYERQPVIDGLFDWTLAHNYGAAFSFLSDAGGWQRWFFTVLAITVSVVLAVWLRRMARDNWREALPVALILGGAIGNVIDRLHHGYVIDFILVYYRDWSWPAFNVADSAICVGAVALIIFSFQSKPATEEAQSGS